MITRHSQEDPYSMTCKFRRGGKIQRIRHNTVRRLKRSRQTTEKSKQDDVTSTSSENSDDCCDFNDDNDDLFRLCDTLNSVPLACAAGSIITQSNALNRRYSVVDGDLISEVVESGNRDQRIYLKKCFELQLAPSMLFIRSLPTQVIDIAQQRLGPQGAKACAQALSHNTSVHTLCMSDNEIGPKGARYISLMLRESRSIVDLNLANNDIGSRGVGHLISAFIEADMMEKLDLSNNCLKDEDAAVFKQLLEESRKLRYLNLSHNYFREEGGRLLGEAIAYNDSLEELDLSWNHLRQAGSVGIAEGLMDNTSIKRLNLAWNGFGLEGCRALKQTLTYNMSLMTLDLTNNRIDKECIRELTRGLAKNTTLKELTLKFNPLTTEGVQDIMDFLAECQTSGINLLDLGIQQVDPLCSARVNEIRLQGRTLKVIHGHVIGNMASSTPKLEKVLVKEHPALILMEYSKLMGFRLMDLFTSMDKTGSRTLSSGEIRNGLKMANVPFSEDLIEALVEKLDDDGDGEIDFSDLLVAQQEHRKQMLKMLEAEKKGDVSELENTPLWRIRTHLQRLMAEKMSDYATFKRAADHLARHLKRTSDQMEAEQEKATKEKARQPRRVKSRPPSSKDNTPDRPQSTSATARRTRAGSAAEILITWAEPIITELEVEAKSKSARMRKRESDLSSTDVTEDLNSLSLESHFM